MRVRDQGVPISSIARSHHHDTNTRKRRHLLIGVTLLFCVCSLVLTLNVLFFSAASSPYAQLQPLVSKLNKRQKQLVNLQHAAEKYPILKSLYGSSSISLMIVVIANEPKNSASVIHTLRSLAHAGRPIDASVIAYVFDEDDALEIKQVFTDEWKKQEVQVVVGPYTGSRGMDFALIASYAHAHSDLLVVLEAGTIKLKGIHNVAAAIRERFDSITNLDQHRLCYCSLFSNTDTNKISESFSGMMFESQYLMKLSVTMQTFLRYPNREATFILNKFCTKLLHESQTLSSSSEQAIFSNTETSIQKPWIPPIVEFDERNLPVGMISLKIPKSNESSKHYLSIGIPTASRSNGAEYAIKTIQSVLDIDLKYNDKTVIIIIVVCGHTQLAINKHRQVLETTFSQSLQNGIIEISSAPVHDYPSLSGLRRNFGDEESRVRWRSHRFQTVLGRAHYFLCLEDDTPVSSDVLPKVYSEIDKAPSPFSMLDLSWVGFAGKVFADHNVWPIALVMGIFYQESPCDWLVHDGNALGFNMVKTNHNKHIIKHLGKVSSFNGKNVASTKLVNNEFTTTFKLQQIDLITQLVDVMLRKESDDTKLAMVSFLNTRIELMERMRKDTKISARVDDETKQLKQMMAQLIDTTKRDDTMNLTRNKEFITTSDIVTVKKLLQALGYAFLS